MTMLWTPTQERIIERLKEQRDRDDREKTEELDNSKKELKELKERLSLLQGDLSDREVRNSTRHGCHTGQPGIILMSGCYVVTRQSQH